MATSASGAELSETLGTSGRLQSLTGVQVLALGAALPEHTVTNADLAELGYDANWIHKRTGIEQRRHAAQERAPAT